MLIICKGAVAPVGAPKITRLREGMPAAGLVGLYLMQEGEAGATISDQFTDLSGGNRHATILPGYSMPVQRDFGLEVAGPYGMMAEVPIPAGMPRFTVLVAARPNMGVSTANLYSTYFGATINGAYASAPSAGKINHPYPVINVAHQTGQRWGLFDDHSVSGVVLPVSGRTVPPNARIVNLPNVFSFTVDGPNDTVRAQDLSSTLYEYTGSSVGIYYDGTDKGNMTIGAWRNAAIAIPDPVFSDLHGFAIYDYAMTAAEASAARARLQGVIAARGVTY